MLKSAGTLIELGFLAGDLKWKDVSPYSQNTYRGYDLFRYTTGETEYVTVEITVIDMDNIKLVRLDAIDGSIIGEFQTFRRLSPGIAITLSAKSSAGKTYLNWVASGNTSGIVGYRIYSGDINTPVSKLKDITGKNITSLNYTHVNPTVWKIYKYTCRSVGSDGSLSVASNVITIRVVNSKLVTMTVGSINMTFGETKKKLSSKVQLHNWEILAPMSEVLKSSGVQVINEVKTKKKCTFIKGNKKIIFTAGIKTASINGKAVGLKSILKVSGSDILVPVKLTAESLGFKYTYNTVQKKVTLDLN